MISIKFLAILIVSFTVNLSTADKNRFDEVSKLIQDVIKNERVPSIVWAKTCWPKVDEFNLIKNSPFQIQISKLNEPINLVLNDNTNKQWFFVDAKCENQQNILSDVDEKYFGHPYRWIIADAANISIQELSFLPGSNIILANRERMSEQYVLKQGFNHHKEHNLPFF